MAVYFLQAGTDGPVKIGHTKHLDKRAQHIRYTSGHRDLRLIRVVDGERPEEKWLHKHFAGARIYGEWFNFRPEMLDIEIPNCSKQCVYSVIENRARAAGLSIDDLCKRAGINRVTWQRWKNGTTKRGPALHTWTAIQEIISGAESNPPTSGEAA